MWTTEGEKSADLPTGLIFYVSERNNISQGRTINTKSPIEYIDLVVEVEG